jgi:hypothetical protein
VGDRHHCARVFVQVLFQPLHSLLISYHFQHAGTVGPALTPLFYAIAIAVSGTGSLILGRIFDPAGSVCSSH